MNYSREDKMYKIFGKWFDEDIEKVVCEYDADAKTARATRFVSLDGGVCNYVARMVVIKNVNKEEVEINPKGLVRRLVKETKKSVNV